MIQRILEEKLEGKDIETVAIVGAGAVGAAIGSMIAEKLPGALTIIADPDRAERYRTRGFLINGNLHHFPVRETTDTLRVDLIIVATKSYDLDAALEIMRSAVGEETMILSLLNGISSEQIIAARFGEEHVLPAMIVGIDSVREDGAVVYQNRGTIHFGPNPEISLLGSEVSGHGNDNSKSGSEVSRHDSGHPQDGAVARVKDFFDRCAIPAMIAPDIRRTLWWKFMVNVGINQVSAILRAPYGVFQRNQEARALMISAMQEVVAVAQASGVGLSGEDIEDWDKTLLRLAPTGKTSMLQDVEAGRRTEVDLFAGTMVKLGEQYGVPVPVNLTLYRMLRTIEFESAAKREA